MKSALNISFPAQSRVQTITYWIATGIVALETAVGAVWDLWQIPFVIEVFEKLGYPAYFLTFMGIWKVPGAIVLIIPKYPRLKEWVYAGLIFTYTGAAFSHIAVGDFMLDPIIFTLLTIVSWGLRPANRRDFIQV